MIKEELDIKLIIIVVFFLLSLMFIYQKVDDSNKIIELQKQKEVFDSKIDSLEKSNYILSNHLQSLEQIQSDNDIKFKQSLTKSNDKRSSIKSETEVIRLGGVGNQLNYWKALRDTARQY